MTNKILITNLYHVIETQVIIIKFFNKRRYSLSFFFFLNDTPPPEIYTLPLHAALPIWRMVRLGHRITDGHLHRLLHVAVVAVLERRSQPAGSIRVVEPHRPGRWGSTTRIEPAGWGRRRSGEHTAELPPPCKLLCPLLLL